MAEAKVWAENLTVGQRFELGQHEVTTDEVMSFARAWDPLPVHIDPAYAEKSVFGGVIGSGLHTLAIFQRLAALGAYRDWQVIAGRGFSDARFVSPLRPGSVVEASIEVLRVAPDRPGRCLVSVRGEVRDGDQTLIMSVISDSYVRKRSG